MIQFCVETVDRCSTCAFYILLLLLLLLLLLWKRNCYETELRFANSSRAVLFNFLYSY